MRMVDVFDFQNVGFEEVMNIKWKFSLSPCIFGSKCDPEGDL